MSLMWIKRNGAKPVYRRKNTQDDAYHCTSRWCSNYTSKERQYRRGGRSYSIYQLGKVLITGLNECHWVGCTDRPITTAPCINGACESRGVRLVWKHKTLSRCTAAVMTHCPRQLEMLQPLSSLNISAIDAQKCLSLGRYQGHG